MQLSTNFTLEEMLASQTATREGYDEQFTPDASIKENLKALCENVLEPISAKLQEKFGEHVSINISSGYRCERDNEKIGGAKTSQHLKGQACDSTNKKMTVEEYYQFVKESGVEFDQLIQEFGHWVHVSYTAVGVNRKECLKAIKVDGVTKYISY